MASLYESLFWAARQAQSFFHLLVYAPESRFASATLTSVATSGSLSHDATVVLGGGIIGLSTAYYLANAMNDAMPGQPFQKHPIYVVDSSQSVCSGASGQATGGLGDFGFGPETAPLGNFSFKLHQQLAASADGESLYGYSPLKIFRVSSDRISPAARLPADRWGPSPPQPVKPDALPDWVKWSPAWKAEILANATHASHLDPGKFCSFLLRRCESLGVTVLLNSSVTSIQRHDSRKHFSSITIEKGKSAKTMKLPCKSLVICAGPWSDRVFSGLFPYAKVKIPLNVTDAAGNYILVQNPRWKPSDDETGAQQVFFNQVIPGTTGCDLTSFPGGAIYVGGYGADPEPLPDRAENVHVQPDAVQAMKKLATRFLRLPVGEKIHIIRAGRCYRPLAIPNKPIITKVDWEKIFSLEPTRQIPFHSYIDEFDGERAPIIQSSRGPLHQPLGGLYVNTGHYSDGVTLALGSGKVMSELILGLPTSADITGLGLNAD